MVSFGHGGQDGSNYLRDILAVGREQVGHARPRTIVIDTEIDTELRDERTRH